MNTKLNTWNTKPNWNKPWYRCILDFIDDTKTIRFSTLTNVIDSIFQNPMPVRVKNNKQYIDVPQDVIIPRKKKVITYQEIEIPVTKYKIKVKKKNKTLTLDLVQWKRRFFILGVCCTLIITSAVLIGFYRVIYWTDGEWRAGVLNYKYNQDIEEAMNPMKAQIQELKSTVAELNNNRIPVVVYERKTRYRIIDTTTKKPVIVDSRQ